MIPGIGGSTGYPLPQASGFDPTERLAAPPLAGSSEEAVINGNNASGVKQKKAEGVEECQTCKNRRYQDGSDDPGVSFKSPTKLSPAQAATAVFAHEREHYVREDSNARAEGREVLSNNIRIFTSVCPECGKTYVSGGETTTVTAKKRQTDEPDSFLQKFFEETIGNHLPKHLDVSV